MSMQRGREVLEKTGRKPSVIHTRRERVKWERQRGAAVGAGSDQRHWTFSTVTMGRAGVNLSCSISRVTPYGRRGA